MEDCEGGEGRVREGGRVGVGEGGRVGGSVGSSSSIPVENEKGYITFGAENYASFPNLTCAQLVFVISSFKKCSLLDVA